MNCTDFEDRLHAQFGTPRLDESPDLTDHARECPGCRTMLEQFRLLSDSLAVWRDQVPDVDLTDAIVSAWQSSTSSRSSRPNNARAAMPRSEITPVGPHTESPLQAGIVSRPFPFPAWSRSQRRTLWLVWGSLAGTLLVIVTLARFLHEAPRSPASPLVAESEDVAPHDSTTDVGPLVAKVPLEIDAPATVPHEARDVYYNLAQKAAGALGEMTVYVMPGSLPPSMSPANGNTAEATGWMDGVKHQLKPIGRSLDDAFDFLWEAGQSADNSKT